MELTEYNGFFSFKNYSKLDWLDSKCSRLEHLVKSLVGIENIRSKLGPHSYGISCYVANRECDGSSRKAHAYKRTVLSVVLGCDYYETEFKKNTV